MITIENGMKISTAQNIFSSAFPFLKLEFFKHPHKAYGGNSRNDLLKQVKNRENVLKNRKELPLTITEDMSVEAVEKLFMEHFGLSTQVFRKSGKIWLETTLTDDWTLKKQNDEGLDLSLYDS